MKKHLDWTTNELDFPSITWLFISFICEVLIHFLPFVLLWWSTSVSLFTTFSNDGSGSKIFEFGSGLVYFFEARVGPDQPSIIWVWKISSKNVKFFYFFAFRSKKISSDQVKKYPGQRQVGLYLMRVKSMLGLSQVKAHLYVPWHLDDWACTCSLLVFAYGLYKC